MQKEGNAINLIPSGDENREKSKGTVVYRMHAVASNGIEILLENDIEEFLGTVMITATFMGCERKYGTVEVRLANKEGATSHATESLRSKKVILLPTYKGRKSVPL